MNNMALCQALLNSIEFYILVIRDSTCNKSDEIRDKVLHDHENGCGVDSRYFVERLDDIDTIKGEDQESRHSPLMVAEQVG